MLQKISRLNSLSMALMAIMALNLYALPIQAEDEDVSLLESFTHRAFTAGAALSPSGKYVAYRQLSSVEGNYFVKVIEARTNKQIGIIGSTEMDILGAFWATDDHLLVNLYQRTLVDGRITDISRLMSVTKDGKTWQQLPKPKHARSAVDEYKKLMTPSVIAFDPEDRNKALVSWSDNLSSRDIMIMDIRSGLTNRIFRAANKFDGYGVDWDGDVRYRVYYDAGSREMRSQVRLKGDKNWVELFSTKITTKSTIDFLRFDKEDPNLIYVREQGDGNYNRISLFNLETMKVIEPVLESKKTNINSVFFYTEGPRRGQLKGYTTNKSKSRVYYFDPNITAMMKTVQEAFPDKVVRLAGHTDDFKSMLIYTYNEKDAGTYYALTDFKNWQKIGKAYPYRKEEDMGDMKYFSFKARDGMKIPSYITTPPKDKFKPPYKTVVMPHGGPWARDNWRHDEWGQLLASHGYAVIQPQFRGSLGWTYDLWKAGDGQWGLSMQDDVEDSVQHMIDKGIVDPDNVAIFGWSYGGYSAFVAAIRNNMFKCSIPGAGLTDMSFFKRRTFGPSRLRALQFPTIAGVNPLDHAEEVEMPMLIVHGDEDQVVPVEQSRMFVNKLKKYNKDFEYLEIKDLGHTFRTFKPHHKQQFYPKLLSFLENKCFSD